MQFRSHVGRPIDLRSPFNIAIGVLVLLTGAIAVVLWLNGESARLIVYAPAYAFITWALLREVDPDHNWTAIVAAAAAGGWILLGGVNVSIFALGVLVVAARVVTESTGRRPLVTDLGALVLAVLVAFTVDGWVAAFGLGVAIYLDDRFADQSRVFQVVTSAVIAGGATLVATLTDALPSSMPEVKPLVAIATGAVALILVVREPAEPVTQVDARHKSFLRTERLHASRSLIGILVFAMSLLTGPDAWGLIPVLFALVLIIISNEVELVRRPDL